jgi:hypothetical protein
MRRIVNKFWEPWLFVFLEVLMEMRFEILRPERLQLEVCISAIDSTLQYSDEFQNLIEKLIASQFPKFFQSISIVVELRIT